MSIFATAPGTVGQVLTVSGQTLPALVSIAGLRTVSGIAITSIGFSQDANVQFMNTLAKRVYIYVFGERMGVVEINGVTFYRPCSGPAGISALFDFYKNNTVSNKSEPTVVTLSDTTIRGFLRGIRSTFSDPEKGVIGFSLLLSTMPVMW